MSNLKALLAATAIAGLVGSGVAFAESTAPAPASPPATKSEPDTKSGSDSVAAKTKQWTLKQWNAAKQKYAQEKEKWSDCQKQAEDQKLKGSKSWSFLADCMRK